jgi:hypothetical protein
MLSKPVIAHRTIQSLNLCDLLQMSRLCVFHPNPTSVSLPLHGTTEVFYSIIKVNHLWITALSDDLLQLCMNPINTPMAPTVAHHIPQVKEAHAKSPVSA